MKRQHNDITAIGTTAPTGRARRVPLMRTCVGCRQVDAASQLWRAVADAVGHLHFQTGQRKDPGRGVYVHRRTSCLQAALRGGLQRSLRRKLCAPSEALLQQLGLHEMDMAAIKAYHQGPRPSQASKKDQDYDS